MKKNGFIFFVICIINQSLFCSDNLICELRKKVLLEGIEYEKGGGINCDANEVYYTNSYSVMPKDSPALYREEVEEQVKINPKQFMICDEIAAIADPNLDLRFPVDLSTIDTSSSDWPYCTIAQLDFFFT